jgi:hypothetical protein
LTLGDPLINNSSGEPERRKNFDIDYTDEAINEDIGKRKICSKHLQKLSRHWDWDIFFFNF